MKFTLEIELGNDEMRTFDHVIGALVNTSSIEHNGWDNLRVGDTMKLHDANGNTVGKWEVVATAGDPHAHIGVGHCQVCGHYGQDCTGTL